MNKYFTYILFLIKWLVAYKCDNRSHIKQVIISCEFCQLFKYLEVLLTLQEIHSLPIKITDGLNYVGNYRRNIDGTKHIIFSTILLPFTDRIPTKNYRRKCSVGNFLAVCRRQLLGTIYRQNTYEKLPTEVFRR